MRWTMLVLVSALWCVGLTGCGSANDPAVANKEQATATQQDSSPRQSVYDFLDAVKNGNDEKAGSLLTALAKQKTAEMEMVVAPPGSDTASFEVAEATSNDGNQAEVPSTWTDLDHEGQPRTDNITWILKKEDVGWRIAGMSTKIFPDQDPVLLNFEDPQQMLAQQQKAEQEAMRRANQQNAQASKPEDPFQQGSQQ